MLSLFPRQRNQEGLTSIVQLKFDKINIELAYCRCTLGTLIRSGKLVKVTSKYMDICITLKRKKCEYDQEIPQSQTADVHPHGTARKSHSTITRHHEDKLSKANSSLFPLKMIAILEWTYSNVQQNIEQLQTPHNGSNNKQKVNNNRTTALERTAT